MVMDKKMGIQEKGRDFVNHFLKILSLILVGFLIGGGSIVSPGLTFILFVYVAVGYLIWKFSKSEDRRFLLILYVSGILLRVVLSLIFYSQAYAQGYSGFLSGDARIYSDKAWEIAQYWLDPANHIFPRKMYGINGYTYMGAFIYSLFGYVPLVLKFINCLLGTASGLLVFSLTKNIFNVKIARLSAIFVVFSPSLIRWSIDSLKDPLIIFLLMLFFWILIKLHKKKWLYLIPLILIILLIKLLGNPLYTILGFTLVLAFFTALKSKPIKIAVLLLLLCSIIFVFILFRLNPINETYDVLRNAAIYQTAQARSDEAGYYIYENTRILEGGLDLFSLPLSYLKGLSYALFSPFPWAVASRLQLFAYPQILLWYFLFPFVLIGFTLSFRYKIRGTLAVWVFIFLVSSLLAFVEGNIGSVFRHRDWISPLFLMFAASGLVWIFNRDKVKVWN